MKRIIVIGHSPAAVKAVEIIRQKDTEAEITILAHSGAFPYRRDFFAEVLSKEKSVEDIQYKENKFYKDNNIKVVTDCNITRINLSRKRVYTESKEQYQFDIVILADLPEGTKLTDLKGGNKEGIYSLRRIKYLDKIIKEMPFFETVVVQSDSFSGLKVAHALIGLGKEVYLVCPQGSIVSIVTEEEVKNYFLKVLADKKLHIIEEEQIIDILGDSDIKAVRLASGKVIGTDIVLLAEAQEDLKLLQDAEITMADGKILVDQNYKTQIDGVYAVDALVDQHVNNWWDDFTATVSLEAQGQIVAAHILEENANILTENLEQVVDFGDVTMAFSYQSNAIEIASFREIKNNSSKQYINIYGIDECAKAAIAINAGDSWGIIKKGLAEENTLDTLFEKVNIEDICTISDNTDGIEESTSSEINPY